MIFNKKLIALAVAITCASSTFASYWQFSVPTDIAGIKEEAFKRGVAVTKWTVDTAYDLGMRADNFSGQRLSAVSSWAFGYVQSVDQTLAGNLSLYASLRGRGLAFYTSVHNTIYP